MTSSMRTWVSRCRRSPSSACRRIRWSSSCTTAVDGYSVTPKNSSAHLQVELSPPGGDRPRVGEIEASVLTRAVMLHGHDRSVLFRAAHRAMLNTYANPSRPVYLNVPRLRGGL